MMAETGLRLAADQRLAPQPLGIIAGGGAMPLAVAARATELARPVHIVGLMGEADRAIERYAHTWVHWGAIGAMLAALERAGCREIVIVGRVSRPQLTAIKPDFGLLRALPELLALRHGGDDSVLSRVVRFFEKRGYAVIGAHQMAPSLVMGEGRLGQHGAGAASAPDIAMAFRLIGALGPFDVGQAAVVAAGRVIAIEGAEGTDAMLARAATVLRPEQAAGERAGIVAKRPKPGQEMRVDMPTIGPRTVTLAADAGLAGIAVLAGEVLIAERESMVATADARAMFVEGVRRSDVQDGVADVVAGSAARASKPRSKRQDSGGRPDIPGLAVLTGRLRSADSADVALGRAASLALREFAAGEVLVVSRLYVLAISAGEPPVATIGRAAGLRQWGLGRVLNGRGVAVVRQRLVADPQDARAVVRAARAAGLAGLAVIREAAVAPAIGTGFVEACAVARLFAVSVDGR